MIPHCSRWVFHPGVAGLLDKAKQLNQQEVNGQASGGQEKNKKGLKGFFKKVKDFSGFSDEPVTGLCSLSIFFVLNSMKFT